MTPDNGRCQVCQGKMNGVYYDLPEPDPDRRLFERGKAARDSVKFLKVCYTCLTAAGALRADGKAPNDYQVKKVLEFRALGYRRLRWTDDRSSGLELDQLLMKRQPHRDGAIHYRILGPDYVILVAPQAEAATLFQVWMRNGVWKAVVIGEQ